MPLLGKLNHYPRPVLDDQSTILLEKVNCTSFLWYFNLACEKSAKRIKTDYERTPVSTMK